ALGGGMSDLPRGRLRGVAVTPLPLAPRPGPPPAGVVTTLADITDHVHAQQLLRTSEERYRGLVDSLPLMVVQFDRQLRIVFLNPATQTITGYTLNEVREPATWQKLVHPDDLPGLLSSLREGLDGKSGRSEARYRAKDGQERFAYCLAQPIVRPLSVVRGPLHSGEQRAASGTPPDQPTDDREVIGVTVLARDRTGGRRLEMELQRAQRRELGGRLSRGTPHDFNTLLTVLRGMAELARNGLPPVHPVQQDLQRISEVGEQ